MPTVHKSFVVPLVSRHVADEDVFKDVLSQLNSLETTVDQVFSNISSRVGNEKRRIEAVNARANMCRELAISLQGSSKAITVFSTAKYPAPVNLPYPVSLQPAGLLVIEDPVAAHPQEASTIYRPANASGSVLSEDGLFDEGLDLFTRLNISGTDYERAEVVMEDDGLGSLPRSACSISSLLLFNSSINPYKNYATLDNLLDAYDRRGRKEAVDDRKTLATAPTTMTDGDVIAAAMRSFDVTFKPQLGELPTLGLPEGLDLPDIARDITFQSLVATSELPSLPSTIAPSYFLSQPKGLVPDILALPPVSVNFNTPPAVAEAVKPHVPAESGGGPTLPPPPPPPTGPSIPAGLPQARDTPPPPSSAVNQAAPPPSVRISPPGEKAAGNGGAGDGQGSARTKPQVGPAATATRASLLDAIKGMDITKLKSAQEQEVQDDKVANKKGAPAEPLSMMEEMRMKLARRQSAISGTSVRGSSGGTAVKPLAQTAPASIGNSLSPRLGAGARDGRQDDSDSESSDMDDAPWSASPARPAPVKQLPPITAPSQTPAPASTLKAMAVSSAVVTTLPPPPGQGLFEDSAALQKLLMTAGRSSSNVEPQSSDDDNEWDDEG